MKDSKDYYGLAPGKSVLLRYIIHLIYANISLYTNLSQYRLQTEVLLNEYRYAFPIKCTDVILADDKETVLEIRAEYDPDKKTKPKVSFYYFKISI